MLIMDIFNKRINRFELTVSDLKTKAESNFRTYLAPSLRQNVYTFGFKQVGTITEWDMMWEKYVDASVVSEKAYILYALAQTYDLWLVQR